MTNSQKEFAVHKESVRYMSKVLDDIAQLVGLPITQYGDSDALMDAIQSLEDAAARWERKLDEKVLAGILEECRGMMWDSSEQELTYTTQAIIKHMKGE